ncbi:FliI/YscN family ATPase [Algirhabdus cladophorae]|uniref:FliI/YscN family ATPase n=1 Tax=Algirhabdus cladophorae TaxID=3377108 RepID=UPI003B84963B
MRDLAFRNLLSEVESLKPLKRLGSIVEVSDGVLHVGRLSDIARMGDRVKLHRQDGFIFGQVVRLGESKVQIMIEGSSDGILVGDTVELIGPQTISPNTSWIGRVVDSNGQPLDGRPILKGHAARSITNGPIASTLRKPMGARLETGMAIFNTMLPLVRGQRIGLFAGSGVGKSTLLASFARNVEAEIVVIALVGERGREVGEFIHSVLGPEGMKRTIVVAATSDASALERRRCAWAAMAIAEHFKEEGNHVLLLLDSLTRFAEAHREIALASGEVAALRGYPPSTAHLLMSLCERAGPGGQHEGDITAVFSVLVAGSDMDEPVADMVRGVLDGHVVMDRDIAERGRFPAIDVLRSVSRSLPVAASSDENEKINQARRLLGSYEQSKLMVQSGLYVSGSDPQLDEAIDVWPALDSFVSNMDDPNVEISFEKLGSALQRTKSRSVVANSVLERRK